jgi:hypothetical protein
VWAEPRTSLHCAPAYPRIPTPPARARAPGWPKLASMPRPPSHRRPSHDPRPVRLGHDSPRVLIFCWKLDKHMLVDGPRRALATQVDDHHGTNLQPTPQSPSTCSALRHRHFGPGGETAYRRNADHGEHHLVADPRGKATIGPSPVDVVVLSFCQKSAPVRFLAFDRRFASHVAPNRTIPPPLPLTRGKPHPSQHLFVEVLITPASTTRQDDEAVHLPSCPQLSP